MHALESFAISSGLKISDPWINQKIFPCAFDKFIIINDTKATNGFNFSNYIELITSINPELESKNIGILFLTEKPDHFSSQNIRLIKTGSIDPAHLTHLIRNAVLTIGADELCAGIASLYSTSNIFIGDHDSILSRGPFFKNKNTYILKQDNDLRINVETISAKIFEILGIERESKNCFTTIHVGEIYNDNTPKIIEVTPEQILSPETLPGVQVNIRIDYQKSALQIDHYKSIFENLKIRKCSIVTDRTFNIKAFEPLKGNITSIIYDITSNIDVDFIKYCRETSPNFGLIFNSDNSESSISTLKDRKLSLIDFPSPIRVISKQYVTLPEVENLSYKSKKIIFSKNKAYLSRAAFNSQSSIDVGAKDSQDLKDIKRSEMKTLLSEDQDCLFIFQNG